MKKLILFILFLFFLSTKAYPSSPFSPSSPSSPYYIESEFYSMYTFVSNGWYIYFTYLKSGPRPPIWVPFHAEGSYLTNQQIYYGNDLVTPIGVYWLDSYTYEDRYEYRDYTYKMVFGVRRTTLDLSLLIGLYAEWHREP